ncbi:MULTISPECIES: OmpA family protein [unclassified Vibrio]|uniref:OmpA family protein n=1 Tax=unclassified Vibrio TaxID=2614977 RepID=UPI002F41EDFB
MNKLFHTTLSLMIYMMLSSAYASDGYIGVKFNKFVPKDDDLALVSNSGFSYGLLYGSRIYDRVDINLTLSKLPSVAVDNIYDIGAAFKFDMFDIRENLTAYTSLGIGHASPNNRFDSFYPKLTLGLTYFFDSNSRISFGYQYDQPREDGHTMDYLSSFIEFSYNLNSKQRESNEIIKESKTIAFEGNDHQYESYVKENVFSEQTGYVLFPKNSSYYSAEENSKVIKFLNSVDRSKILNIVVTGHTDSNGDDSYNLLMSKKRAYRVADLIVNLGLEDELTSVNFEGEKNPLVENDTEEGMATNRRVEIKIIYSND